MHTKEAQAIITPEKALQLLKEGNIRFQNNLKAHHDLLEQVNETREGQFPFAAILSCIDSRVSAELVFDQGLGDIFSIRVAGNVINDDILGSMEFSAKLAGAKLIVVLGHTRCGAIQGACENAELGKLTGLLEKIKPAIEEVEPKADPHEFAYAVSMKNVEMGLSEIRRQSKVLREMEEKKEIGIVGAMYDVATGKVDFL